MWSFVGLIIFPCLYLGGRVFRTAGAWLERKDGPKDRVLPKLVLAAVVGFLLGCFVQPKWDDIYSYYEVKGHWDKCVIPFSR